MKSSFIPNRHTACAGIHGEWSDKTSDRPLKASDLFWGALAFGAMFFVMCAGAAAGF